MSIEHKKMVDTYPDGKKIERTCGKHLDPTAGSFKSGAILDKLPSHQPITGGEAKASNFQDLRSSTIKKGSI
jgi:hypothetical protein